MAGARVQDGIATATGSWTTTGISKTLGAAPTNGNVLVAFVGLVGGTGRTITPPASGPTWTSRGRINNSTNITIEVFTRTAGASESATQGAWTADTASVHGYLYIEELSGVTETGYVIATGNTGNGTSQAHTTGTLANGVVYALVGSWGIRTTSSYTVATMTERQDASTSGGTNITGLGADEITITGTGATVSRTATAANSNQWAAITIAFPEGTPPVALSGTTAGSSTTSGDIGVTKALGGTTAGGSTTTGNLVITAALSGVSAGASTDTGNLTITAALVGTTAGGSGTTGNLDVIPPAGTVDLSGTSIGTSSTTGNLNVTYALSGVSLGDGGEGGNLTLIVALSGVSIGSSGDSGTLSTASTSMARSRAGAFGTMGRAGARAVIVVRSGYRRV